MRRLTPAIPTSKRHSRWPTCPISAPCRSTCTASRTRAPTSVALRRAIANIRDEAAPILEQLATRKELPSTALPELRKVFTRTRPIRDWHVVGPFPFKTEPPFPLAKSAAPDFQAKFPGYRDEPLVWKKTRAIDNHGQVDLGRIYSSDDDIAAFGAAEFESPTDRKAEFVVGSDDTLTVWLNGEKVYDFQNRRGFNPDENRFDAPVVKGKNHVVIKCGNNGGGWQFAVSVAYPSDYVFLKGPIPGGVRPGSVPQVRPQCEGQSRARQSPVHGPERSGLREMSCRGRAGGPGWAGIVERRCEIPEGRNHHVRALSLGENLVGL